MFFAPHDAQRGGIDLCLVLTSEGPFLMCKQPFAAFLFLAARAEECIFAALYSRSAKIAELWLLALLP